MSSLGKAVSVTLMVSSTLVSDPRVCAVFDGIPSSIAILDLTGSIIYVNAAWRNFAAGNNCSDPRAHLGANYLRACERSAEAGDEFASEALTGIRNVISGNAKRYIQRYPCDVNGVERWFMLTASRGAQSCEIVIAHDDITAIVEAENEGIAERYISRPAFRANNTVIVLVYPSRLISEALRNLLDDTPRRFVIKATSFRTIQFEAFKPEDKLVFLVGGRSGDEIVESVRGIRQRQESAHIVVLSATGEPAEVKLALEAGANCFLRDAMTPQTLLTAVELVLQGEIILPAEFLNSLPSFGGAPDNVADFEHQTPEQREIATPGENGRILTRIKLSVREETILQGLVEGAPNKVIAQRLGITESTVKVHVKAILRKIRVQKPHSGSDVGR